MDNHHYKVRLVEHSEGRVPLLEIIGEACRVRAAVTRQEDAVGIEAVQDAIPDASSLPPTNGKVDGCVQTTLRPSRPLEELQHVRKGKIVRREAHCRARWLENGCNRANV